LAHNEPPLFVNILHSSLKQI